MNSYEILKKCWEEKRESIKDDINNKDLWSEIYDNIFIKRLNNHFLNPVEELLYAKTDDDKYKNIDGWGFSIMVILSSLIEHLSSIVSGKIETQYLENKENVFNNIFCYNNTSDIKKFNSIFQNFPPFNNQNIIPILKDDFFKNIRSSLFHDSMTSRNWKIKTYGSKAIQQLEENNFTLDDYPIVKKEEFNLLYRESFFFALKTIFIKDLKTKCNEDELIGNNNVNLRLSLARKLDIIYSEGNFENIDFYSHWWIPTNFSKKTKDI